MSGSWKFWCRLLQMTKELEGSTGTSVRWKGSWGMCRPLKGTWGLSFPLPFFVQIQLDCPFLDIFGWPLGVFLVKWRYQPFLLLYWIIIEEPLERIRSRETSLCSKWVTLPLNTSIAKKMLHCSFSTLNALTLLALSNLHFNSYNSYIFYIKNAYWFLFLKYSHKCWWIDGLFSPSPITQVYF